MKCLALLVFVIFLQSLDAYRLNGNNNVQCKTCRNSKPVQSGGQNFHFKLNNGRNSFAESTARISAQNKLRLGNIRRSGAQRFPNVSNIGLSGSVQSVTTNLQESFGVLIDNLEDLSECSSQIISDVSSQLLSGIEPIVSHTGSTLQISSIAEVLPDVFESIVQAVSLLEIETITDPVIASISDIRIWLQKLIGLCSARITPVHINAINNVVTALTKSIQVFVNNITVIFNTSVNVIGNISQSVQDSVASLALVLDSVLVVTQTLTITITTTISVTVSSTSTTITTLNTLLVTVWYPVFRLWNNEGNLLILEYSTKSY